MRNEILLKSSKTFYPFRALELKKICFRFVSFFLTAYQKCGLLKAMISWVALNSQKPKALYINRNQLIFIRGWYPVTKSIALH